MRKQSYIVKWQQLLQHGFGTNSQLSAFGSAKCGVSAGKMFSLKGEKASCHVHQHPLLTIQEHPWHPRQLCPSSLLEKIIGRCPVCGQRMACIKIKERDKCIQILRYRQFDILGVSSSRDVKFTCPFKMNGLMKHKRIKDLKPLCLSWWVQEKQALQKDNQRNVLISEPALSKSSINFGAEDIGCSI